MGAVGGGGEKRLLCPTWVTSTCGWGVTGWCVLLSNASGGSMLPRLLPGFSSWLGWFMMTVTHSSTWKCKKLFQVYLKNKFCRPEEEGDKGEMQA